MVWGYFSRYGTRDLEQFKGITEKEQYKTTNETSATPSELRHTGDRKKMTILT